MSLLLRDEVSISLSPGRVKAVHFSGGFRPSVKAKKMISCDPPALKEILWKNTLDGLEAVLHALEGDKMNAKVILSNHFVRYALVPWSDQISNAGEERAFVRHSFAQIYGDDVRHWELRVSPGGYGEAQVASAIDHGLLEGIERIVTSRGFRLVSTQPYFMSVFNRWRKHLQEDHAWFVVAEPGRLCVSQLQQGVWRSLRTIKVNDDWLEALRILLERELLVSESGAECNTVYLVAPDLQIGRAHV